jgi:hypothetical protein
MSSRHSHTLGFEPLARGFDQFDLERLELRSIRIESFFNAHLLPFLAINAIAIGALVMQSASPSIYASFAPGLFLPSGVLWLMGLKASRGRRPLTASAGPALCAIFAAGGFEFLPFGAVLILAVFLLLALAVWHGSVSPLAAAIPCLYLPWAGLRFAAEADGARFALFAIVFTILFAAVVHGYGIGKAIPLFSSLILFLVVEYSESNNSTAVALGGVAFFVVAFVIYEFKARWDRHSDLRRFLAQGLVVVALTLVLNVFDVDWSIWAYAMTGLLLVYHLAVSKGFREARPAPRVLWIAVWLAVSPWTTYGEADSREARGEFWYANLASWIVLLAAHHIMGRLGSRFGLNGIRAAALVILMLVMHGTSELRSEWDVHRPLEPGAAGITDFLGAIALGFFGATWVAATRRPVHEAPAYWRGFVLPRHAAILRRLVRTASNHIKAVPVIGNLVSVIAALLTSWKYLKGKDGAVSFGDITGLAAFTFGALATTDVLTVCFAGLSMGATPEPSGIPPDRLALIVAWACWGLTIYLHGYLADNLFYRLAASVFVLVPILTTLETKVAPQPIEWGILLIAAALPLLVFGLLRHTQSTVEKLQSV